MYKLLFILILLSCKEAVAQSKASGISGVELNTIEGKKYVWHESDELCVFVFLSTSCPLSQKYTLPLNGLADEFQGRVKFYGVFTDTDLRSKEYKTFRNKYKIHYRLFIDGKKQLVKALTASVTPEAFVLNKGRVIYQGAIDDWAIELGKTKKTATVNFVRNAIQCALSNTTPVPAYSKPSGCFID